MSKYIPDRWVVLEFTSPQYGTIRKVFGGWYGGYLSGDSWRLNSGITREEVVDGILVFHGNSGSEYACHPDGYGLSAYMEGVLSSYMRDITELGEGYTMRIVGEYEPK